MSHLTDPISNSHEGAVNLTFKSCLRAVDSSEAWSSPSLGMDWELKRKADLQECVNPSYSLARRSLAVVEPYELRRRCIIYLNNLFTNRFARIVDAASVSERSAHVEARTVDCLCKVHMRRTAPAPSRASEELALDGNHCLSRFGYLRVYRADCG